MKILVVAPNHKPDGSSNSLYFLRCTKEVNHSSTPIMSAAKARETAVEKYSWQVVASRIKHIYDRIIT